MSNYHLVKRFHTLLGTVAILCCVGTSASAQTASPVRADLSNSAEINFQQGNITLAIQQWSKEIRDKNNIETALYNRSQAYILLDQHEFAIKDLDTLIEIQKGNTPAAVYIVKGVTLAKLNQPEEAIKNFNQAERIQPSELVYNNRALVYQQLGKFDKAVKDLEKSIALKPTPLHRLNLTNVRLQMGDFSRVVNETNAVLEQEPKFFPAYITRGIAYYNLGMYEAAIRDFVISLKIRSDQPQAYYYAGLSFNKLKHNKEAVENLLRAADLYLQERQPQFYHQILEKVEEIEG